MIKDEDMLEAIVVELIVKVIVIAVAAIVWFVFRKRRHSRLLLEVA